MDIVREALLDMSAKYSAWLTLTHTTESERELARIKLELIEDALERNNWEGR